MPRRPRKEAPGAIHHVVARGNAGGSIAFDEDDLRALESKLARTSESFGWRIHAYCLMGTHIHIVVETPVPTLGSGMQRLLGGYAFDFNRRHDRFGHLFAGPFSASAITTDTYAIEVGAYVVLNPVRAGVVRAPEDWRWSSYRASAGLVKVPPFVETRLLPGLLHEDPTRAQELYREHVRDVAARPRTGSR
jgi:putative transposase